MYIIRSQLNLQAKFLGIMLNKNEQSSIKITPGIWFFMHSQVLKEAWLNSKINLICDLYILLPATYISV